MTSSLIAAGAGALSFLALDMIWLTIMTPAFYRPQLGDLVAANVRLPAAAIFYLIYVGVLNLLVIQPALNANAANAALWNGALFGLGAYATYNLTNLATLTRWPVLLTFIDTAWGAAATAAAAYIAVRVAMATGA